MGKGGGKTKAGAQKPTPERTDFVLGRRIGIMCCYCGAILVSYSDHDFRMCKCENGAYVDGGSEYLRVGARKPYGITLVEVRGIGTPQRGQK